MSNCTSNVKLHEQCHADRAKTSSHTASCGDRATAHRTDACGSAEKDAVGVGGRRVAEVQMQVSAMQ
eukprot:16245-Rhodomonas_salina.1